MDNLLHGTDTMTIISSPNPKYDTLVDYTFDPRNVDFRIAQLSIKGVKHDQIIRGNNTCIYLAPGRLFYDQTTRRHTLKVNSQESIPKRTWKEFYHGPNPSFAEPLPFKADWEDSIPYEPTKMFNVKLNGEPYYQYQRKDKVNIVFHPTRVNTKQFRLNLMDEKAIDEKRKLALKPPRDLRFVHRSTITREELLHGTSDDLVIGEATGQTVTESHSLILSHIRNVEIDGLPYWFYRRPDETTIYLHQSRVKKTKSCWEITTDCEVEGQIPLPHTQKVGTSEAISHGTHYEIKSGYVEKPRITKSPKKGTTATSSTGTEPKDLLGEIVAAQEATFSKEQPEVEKETVTPTPKEITFPNQNAPPFCPLGFSKDNETQEILEQL